MDMDKVSVGCKGQKMDEGVRKWNYTPPERQKWTWSRLVLDVRVRKQNYTPPERQNGH